MKILKSKLILEFPFLKVKYYVKIKCLNLLFCM